MVVTSKRWTAGDLTEELDERALAEDMKAKRESAQVKEQLRAAWSKSGAST